MNRNLLIFLAILIVSSIPRLIGMNLMEFKTDEAVNILLAVRPLLGQGLTPGGTVSSLGILNPPFFNYFLLPIVFINRDPKFIASVIALINALSIPFFFLILKKYYNERIAFISSILLAASPWAILYSRKIWMQDLLIPFFVGLLFCLHKLIFDRKKIYWIPYTALSLLLIQLHPVSLIFLILLTIFILRKAKTNFKFIFIGFVIGIIPLIPYISYEYKNSCPDCQYFIEVKNKLSNERSLELFLRPLEIPSEGDFRFVIGNDTLTLKNDFPFLDYFRKIFYLEYIFVPLSLIVFYRKFKKTKFLVFCLVFVPIIYYLLKIEPFMHYYIIVIPVLFLALGSFLDFLFSRKNKYISILSSIFVVFIFLISEYYNFAVFKILNSKGALAGDYGSAYYKTEIETKRDIKQFEGHSDYEEVFLSSFIPLGYTYGYMPLGKILYGNTTPKEASKLEDELHSDTKDPRVVQRLFAYYTQKKPNLDTLDLLRVKSLNLKEYQPIYDEVLRDYLHRNLKKEFESPNLGIRFFYPEHWLAKEEKNSVLLTGDGKEYHITDDMKKTSDNVLNEIIVTIRPL